MPLISLCTKNLEMNKIKFPAIENSSQVPGHWEVNKRNHKMINSMMKHLWKMPWKQRWGSIYLNRRVKGIEENCRENMTFSWDLKDAYKLLFDFIKALLFGISSDSQKNWGGGIEICHIYLLDSLPQLSNPPHRVVHLSQLIHWHIITIQSL